MMLRCLEMAMLPSSCAFYPAGESDVAAPPEPPQGPGHAYSLRPDDGYPSSDNTLSRHPRCYHVSLYRRALIACSADITDTANNTFPYPFDTLAVLAH